VHKTASRVAAGGAGGGGYEITAGTNAISFPRLSLPANRRRQFHYCRVAAVGPDFGADQEQARPRRFLRVSSLATCSGSRWRRMTPSFRD